jgi:riboflavin-specific deaminase-like protein
VSARPEVIANFALSWDGRVAAGPGGASDFSSPSDKRRLLEIRALGDAVLAGRGTVEADRMSMGISADDLRSERVARGLPPEPLRVIWSGSGRLDPALKVFANRRTRLVVYTTPSLPPRVARALARRAHVEVRVRDRIDPAAALAELRALDGVGRLVCEGGPTTFRGLVEARCVDELRLTVCPKIFGGLAAPGLLGAGDAFLPCIRRARLVEWERVDDEFFLRYQIGASGRAAA